ncbi:unnamed protein product [Pleuronectes platessa]|uniref:Uncharacterized protein n=1 Tax=Pleuronectes platessa TaxID=8262 RepID=A0A9N7Y6R2_PLEPL|nr:unnamed protein product [Pleuronectes platessa]
MAPVRVVEGGVLHGVMQLTGGQLTVKDDSLSEATQILTGAVETVQGEIRLLREEMAAMTAAGTTEGDQDGGHEGHRSRRETPSCSASGSVKSHRSPSPDGARGGPASAHAFKGGSEKGGPALETTLHGEGVHLDKVKTTFHHDTQSVAPERWDLSRPPKKGAPALHQSDDEWEKEHKIGASTSIGRATQKRKAKRGRRKRESTQAPGQSPGMCDFHPWGFADMTGLIEGLPPLTSGATPWIEVFETLTMGNNLAAGDLRRY